MLKDSQVGLIVLDAMLREVRHGIRADNTVSRVDRPWAGGCVSRRGDFQVVDPCAFGLRSGGTAGIVVFFCLLDRREKVGTARNPPER
jgi:hypothetical protein